MEAAHDAGRQSGPPPAPADQTMKARSRGEAARVAGVVFLCAGLAISSLVLGIWIAGAMVWGDMQEDQAGPSWFALVLIPLAPLFGLYATAVLVSGALALGVVLAAAAAALLRRVPFWVLLAIAAPCLAASHIQIAWAINFNYWGRSTWGEPLSPGALPLVVLCRCSAPGCCSAACCSRARPLQGRPRRWRCLTGSATPGRPRRGRTWRPSAVRRGREVGP